MKHSQMLQYFLLILPTFICVKFGYCQQTLIDSSVIELTIVYNLSIPTDTLNLNIGTTTINSQYKEYKAVRASNGTFTFCVKSIYPYGYLRLIKSRTTRRNDNRILINNVFWESGDKIKIEIKEENNPKFLITREFSGVGSAKYIVWEEIEQSAPSFFQKLKADPMYTQDSLAKDKLIILDRYKSKISTLSYDIQKIGILMRKWIIDINKVKNTYPEPSEQIEEAKKMKQLYCPMKRWIDNDEALANSIDYISFYTLYFSLYPAYAQGTYNKEQFFKANVHRETSLQLIGNSSSGTVRQSLIVYFLSMMGSGSNLEPKYKKVKDYFTDNRYLQQFNSLLSKQEINISQFTFIDSYGKNVSLSDFAGKVILLDTWFTGCGGCATYYKNVISKLEDYFENNDKIRIISISSDMSEDVWKRSVMSGIYSNPKGINLYTAGQQMNHPMYKLFAINSAPVPILIDRNGHVRLINSLELYDFGSLIKEIESML